MIQVILNWKKDYHDPEYSWTEACIWAMEQFGLPGSNTYKVKFSDDYLTFHFNKEQDAILMKLRWQ